jgi:predicted small lipoprotein YifL
MPKHAVGMKNFAVAFLLASLAGCGGPLTYAVHGTSSAPDADAKIVADVHKDNGFTTLNVTVENLAPPDRLGGGKEFVVWTKGAVPKWHRVGSLKYDEGDRKAKMEGASVPTTSFELKVTVEQDPAPELPSDVVVVKQQVN